MLVADITNGGTDVGHTVLQKNDFAIEEGADYDVRLYIGASKELTVLTAIQNAESVNIDSTFRSVTLNSGIQVIKMGFTADRTADNMKISVYAGNGGENYSVFLEKVEIYKSTGIESGVEIYSEDFSVAADVTVKNTAYDEVSTVSVDNGALKVEIPNYPDNRGEVWLRSFSLETDINIEADVKYRVSADVNVTAAQTFYFNYEAASLAFDTRAGQNGGQLDGRRKQDRCGVHGEQGYNGRLCTFS